jgi:integrase
MPGMVYKRGDIWWYSFYYKGKKYRASAKTEKKREAEKILAHYLGQLVRGEFQGFQHDQILTIDNLLTLALDEAEMKELRDIYHMRFRAKHLTKFFGKDYAVEAITEAALARYVASRRKQGIKLSTVNRELSLLRSALRLAKKRKLIKDMPEIDRFQEHNVRMVFFEHDVYEAVRSHISEVLQDMMRFAYLTGWRKGQIARLEWRNVQDGVIRLSGKTVKHKDVQVLSLAGELAAIIERRQAARNGPWVFHRSARPIRDFREA